MVSWRNGIMRGDRKFYLLVYTFQGCFIFLLRNIYYFHNSNIQKDSPT